MEMTFEQLSEALTRFGIIEDEDLHAALREVGLAESNKDAKHLLDHLVDTGRLTSFQAERIASGEAGGLVIGNYVLLSRLGEGGMGVVYKALHRRMKREVALKIIRSSVATPEFVVRFHREIEAAARLVHANIIAAYDADESEMGDFLVMEYVAGADFKEIIERSGPLPLSEAIKAIREAASGLEFAHSQLVIHRDIKPANLMRTTDGITKIADLGLARMVEPDDETSGNLTQQKMVAGTVDYMSPEQGIDSSTVDQRADIYSLGCTFFHMVMGRAPFHEGSLLDRLLAHRQAPIPQLHSPAENIPPEVDAIYQKMMAKNPQERFQSMQEVVNAIDDLDHSQVAERGDSARPLEDCTVLIVEPSRLQSSIVKRMLNQAGVDDVHIATSADEAIAQLTAMATHLILMSAQLPDRSGLVLAEKVREAFRWTSLPIIMMTATVPTESEGDALARLGDARFLIKPFDSDKLKEMLTSTMSAKPVEAQELAALSELQVLIVDDSSVAQRHVQRTMEDLGFQHFSVVPDGTDAIDQLNQRQFDIVITDYNMPKMNGNELVRWVRTEGQQPDIPIVMVTTEFDPIKLGEVYQLGVSAICGKSFDKDLVKKIMVRLFL